MDFVKECCNDPAFSKPKSVDFFLFSIILALTFRELVITFPSLSWHQTDIVFVNQHSHKMDTQYTCPYYYIFISLHLHYIIVTYSWVCILVLVSLSTRVYTWVSNGNFTQLVHSFVRSSCEFTTQHLHKIEYHINILMTSYLHIRTSTSIFHYSFHYKSLQKCRMANI